MTVYAGYIDRLAQELERQFFAIKSGYNFDLGDEFELALCRALNLILPEGFGVARGHVVSQSGDTAGDDILIYEKHRMPTLGLRAAGDLASKEFIPIEAIFAYVECKNTVFLEGKGPQSLMHANQQVAHVKRLLLRRAAVPLGELSPGFTTGSGISVEPRPGFPEIRNPPFGMVVSRMVRLKQGTPELATLDHQVTNTLSDEVTRMLTEDEQAMTDVVVLGPGALLLPTQVTATGQTTRAMVSPFAMPSPGEQRLPLPVRAEGRALAVGICALMSALQYVQLGRMNWPAIMADAVTSAP